MKIKNETSVLLGIYLDELHLSHQKEFHFCANRKWASDFYVPAFKLLIEIEGGVGYFKNPKGQIIRGGRHNREVGFTNDIRKYNEAQRLGYRLIRFSTGMVLNGEAKEILTAWLHPNLEVAKK